MLVYAYSNYNMTRLWVMMDIKLPLIRIPPR